MARSEHQQDATNQTQRPQKRRSTPVSEESFLSIAGLDPESGEDRRLFLLMKAEALHVVRTVVSRPVEEARF